MTDAVKSGMCSITMRELGADDVIALADRAGLAGIARSIALRLVSDRLAYLHVFAWGPRGIAERYPLADRAELWVSALAIAAEAPPLTDGRARYALLEYVVDDDPEQLVADAATLNAWIAQM